MGAGYEKLAGSCGHMNKLTAFMFFVEFLDQLCEYYYFTKLSMTRSTAVCKSIGRFSRYKLGKRYLQLHLTESAPYLVLSFHINAFERYIIMLLVFM
jgi:hypothetical protein